MFDKKEPEIAIDEIIHGLKEGEKNYRWAKNGLVIAQGVKQLQTRNDELTKSNEVLEKSNFDLKEQETASNSLIQSNITKARKIISDTEDQAAQLIGKAQASILEAQNKADDELRQTVEAFAVVKEEIQKAEVERDKVKAEINDLKDTAAKTKAQILGGVSVE